MIKDIDFLCDNQLHIQIDDKTPLYQSKPILFLEKAPAVWKKLQETFLESCHIYLNKVKNFCNNQESIEIIGSRAWFYKGWKSLNQKQSNPWHQHYPAFLSGVFYLRIPTEEGGTEFMDPRQNEAKTIRNQMLAPIECTWVIFPGWLFHRSGYCDSESPRYVIAADSYVKVN